MKIVTSLLILLSAPIFAATKNQDICDSLSDKAIENCKVSMCEDWLRDENKKITKKNVNECLNNSDGDLMEGAQICAIDGGELDRLIAAYNAKNPKKKVNCEE